MMDSGWRIVGLLTPNPAPCLLCCVGAGWVVVVTPDHNGVLSPRHRVGCRYGRRCAPRRVHTVSLVLLFDSYAVLCVAWARL